MLSLVYASTLSARPFTLSLRQPSAVQPEGRPAVEFEGALAVGAAAADDTTEEDEGSAMLMLFTLNAVSAQLPPHMAVLSPAQAMLQVDAARLLPWLFENAWPPAKAVRSGDAMSMTT